MTRRLLIQVATGCLGLALVCFGVVPGPFAVGHAQTGGWSVRATLPLAVTGAAASVGMDGKIYIFGGNTFAQSVTNAEVFDPKTNAVTPIAPLPVGLSFMGATLGYDGKIYIAGGWEGSETAGQSVGTLLAYDPRTNTYACSFSGPGCSPSNLAPLLLPVSEEGVAAGVDGLIYVVGGFATAPTNMVQLYDPIKNVWYQGSHYPTADAGLRAVVSPGGVLYAGLGFDGQKYVNAIHHAATWHAGALSREAWIRPRQQYTVTITITWDASAFSPQSIRLPPWLSFPQGTTGAEDDPPPDLIPSPAGDKYSALGSMEACGSTCGWGGPTSTGGNSDGLHPRDQTYYGTDSSDIYTMGGENNGPSLPNPTEDATTATAGGVVYLIGGDNGTRPTSAILGYNAPPPPGPTPAVPTATATAPPASATATTAPTSTATATVTPAPTDTATPAPTSTPVPLTVTVRAAHKSVRAGQKQTLTVRTAPGASVAITATFPSGRKLHHTGTSGSSGTVTWHFTEPKGVAKGKNHTVNVIAKVTDASGQAATATTHYSG